MSDTGRLAYQLARRGMPRGVIARRLRDEGLESAAAYEIADKALDRVANRQRRLGAVVALLGAAILLTCGSLFVMRGWVDEANAQVLGAPIGKLLWRRSGEAAMFGLILCGLGVGNVLRPTRDPRSRNPS